MNSARLRAMDFLLFGGGDVTEEIARRQAMPLVHVHSSPAVIGAGLPERRFWSVTDKSQGRSE